MGKYCLMITASAQDDENFGNSGDGDSQKHGQRD